MISDRLNWQRYNDEKPEHQAYVWVAFHKDPLDLHLVHPAQFLENGDWRGKEDRFLLTDGGMLTPRHNPLWAEMETPKPPEGMDIIKTNIGRD